MLIASGHLSRVACTCCSSSRLISSRLSSAPASPMPTSLPPAPRSCRALLRSRAPAHSLVSRAAAVWLCNRVARCLPLSHLACCRVPPSPPRCSYVFISQSKHVVTVALRPIRLSSEPSESPPFVSALSERIESPPDADPPVSSPVSASIALILIRSAPILRSRFLAPHSSAGPSVFSRWPLLRRSPARPKSLLPSLASLVRIRPPCCPIFPAGNASRGDRLEGIQRRI